MTGVDGGSTGGAHGNARSGIRARVWILASLALAFYLGFIALTFYRSHH